MAMEERTQSIRSLDHIGAAGIRLRGDSRVAGGADVCATQAMDIKRNKAAVRRIRRNNGMLEYWKSGGG
jgi:hypothetical protein